MYHHKGDVSILSRSSCRSIPPTFCSSAVEPLTVWKRSWKSALPPLRWGLDTTAWMQDVIPHDLVKFGLIPELVGRLPVIAALNGLDEDSLVRILTEPRNSLLNQYKKLFQLDKVNLEFQPEALRAVARKTIERKTGARGLRSIMEEILTTLMYEVPSDYTVEQVTITPETVEKGEPPLLTYNPDRKPVKIKITTSRKRGRKDTA